MRRSGSHDSGDDGSPTDRGADHGVAPRPVGLVRDVARVGARWLTLLTVATLASTAVALFLPTALAAAVDAALGGGGVGSATLRLAGVLAASLVLGAAVHVAEAYCTAGATVWLRRGLVRHVLRLGLAGEQRFAAGDLTSRVVGSAPQAAGLAPLLVDSVADIALSVGGMTALWMIDWRIVAALAPVVPVGMVLVLRFSRRATDQAARYQRVQGEISARLVDALAGVRTIRAAGTTRQEVERVLAPLPELSAAGSDLWRGHGELAGRAALLVPLAGVVALAVGGQGLVAGRITAGQLLAVAGYVPMALGLLYQSSLLVRVGRLRAGTARLTEVLAVAVRPAGSRRFAPGPGELVLRGVTVRAAAGVPVLDRIDLTLPAGGVTAVVGRSGAGKTTLAAVAGRLLDPDEGEVTLDGLALSDAAVDAVRAEISYAFDRPRLLGATIADAIGYGGVEVSAQEVRHAASVARADRFVRRLPCGFDTPLDRAPMSDGERQRLGLARAFSRSGRLLILDDATSSLDTVTEAQVGAALTGAMPGRTRLVVAHRMTTAARADQVAWLDAGRIRAVASHHELWADPEYRALFDDGAPFTEPPPGTGPEPPVTPSAAPSGERPPMAPGDGSPVQAPAGAPPRLVGGRPATRDVAAGTGERR